MHVHSSRRLIFRGIPGPRQGQKIWPGQDLCPLIEWLSRPFHHRSICPSSRARARAHKTESKPGTRSNKTTSTLLSITEPDPVIFLFCCKTAATLSQNFIFMSSRCGIWKTDMLVIYMVGSIQNSNVGRDLSANINSLAKGVSTWGNWAEGCTWKVPGVCYLKLRGMLIKA